MDFLLKASQNFEQVNNEFDEKVFIDFMKQVTIWDYYGLSKDDYLALPEPEKRVKISQYYSEMKCKDTGEFFLCLICLICCLLRLIEVNLSSIAIKSCQKHLVSLKRLPKDYHHFIK